MSSVSSNRSSNETIAFEIAKYSRARQPLPVAPVDQLHPAGRFVQSNCNSNKTPISPNQIEWTHFNQPRLTLHADVAHTETDVRRNTGTGLPRYARRISLKVIWNSDPQSTSSNSVIPQIGLTSGPSSIFVLEQIDLNKVVDDFSNSRLGEVPLKAVYKDCVVGLRYAVSHEAGSLIYNRFQIRFHTPTDSLDFVRIIEFICPCKLSPQDRERSHHRASQTPFAPRADSFLLQSTQCHPNVEVGADQPIPVASDANDRVSNLSRAYPRLPVVLEACPMEVETNEARAEVPRVMTTKPRNIERDTSRKPADQESHVTQRSELNPDAKDPQNITKSFAIPQLTPPKTLKPSTAVGNEENGLQPQGACEQLTGTASEANFDPQLMKAEITEMAEDQAGRYWGAAELTALSDAQLLKDIQEILNEPNFLVLVDRVQRLIGRD